MRKVKIMDFLILALGIFITAYFASALWELAHVIGRFLGFIFESIGNLFDK